MTPLATRYRIADLNTDTSRAFDTKHGVGKVTLLLFDGRGRRVGTVQALTPTTIAAGRACPVARLRR